MSDIVKRLRGWPSSVDRPARTRQLCNEAADLIDRLTTELDAANKTIATENHAAIDQHIELTKERDQLRANMDAARVELCALIECPDHPDTLLMQGTIPNDADALCIIKAIELLGEKP